MPVIRHSPHSNAVTNEVLALDNRCLLRCRLCSCLLPCGSSQRPNLPHALLAGLAEHILGPLQLARYLQHSRESSDIDAREKPLNTQSPTKQQTIRAHTSTGLYESYLSRGVAHPRQVPQAAFLHLLGYLGNMQSPGHVLENFPGTVLECVFVASPRVRLEGVLKPRSFIALFRHVLESDSSPNGPFKNRRRSGRDRGRINDSSLKESSAQIMISM